jgi:hypothetical protein
MFRHRRAILKDFFRKKSIQAQQANLGYRDLDLDPLFSGDLVSTKHSLGTAAIV